MFSIKAWTISQRFLHTGDSVHRDFNQPMQMHLKYNHIIFPNILEVPFPKPSPQKDIAVLEEGTEDKESS